MNGWVLQALRGLLYAKTTHPPDSWQLGFEIPVSKMGKRRLRNLDNLLQVPGCCAAEPCWTPEMPAPPAWPWAQRGLEKRPSLEMRLPQTHPLLRERCLQPAGERTGRGRRSRCPATHRQCTPPSACRLNGHHASLASWAKTLARPLCTRQLTPLRGKRRTLLAPAWRPGHREQLLRKITRHRRPTKNAPLTQE